MHTPMSNSVVNRGKEASGGLQREPPSPAMSSTRRMAASPPNRHPHPPSPTPFTPNPQLNPKGRRGVYPCPSFNPDSRPDHGPIPICNGIINWDPTHQPPPFYCQTVLNCINTFSPPIQILSNFFSSSHPSCDPIQFTRRSVGPNYVATDLSANVPLAAGASLAMVAPRGGRRLCRDNYLSHYIFKTVSLLLYSKPI